MEAGHVTNFQDPDFLSDLLRDLNKQKFYLRKSLAPATVLDGVQLCAETTAHLRGRSRRCAPAGPATLSTPTATFTPRWRWISSRKLRRQPTGQKLPLQAVGSEHGAPATGMKESAARTDATAAPAAAGTVDSGTKTAGTEAPADPVPDMVLTRPPPGALPGNLEVKAAAAKVAVMEAATEAATAETTAAATAGMKPQANVAEATTGEVAVVDGSAAAPAEAATVSTSHSPFYTPSVHQSFLFF
jgi:hypothetical protein